MEYSVRQGVRFPPDDGAVAWIDPNVFEDGRDFTPTFAALIINEALTGCGLITLHQDWLKEGMICTVQVERLAPLKAEIRWVKELGEGVVKLGVAFLE